MAPSSVPLERYNAKRDFTKTPEPAGQAAANGERLSFVIQKHWATRLHYDFRLELDGVLVSWAVPKGPSFDPTVKRMAIHVEDHPVSYGGFEGQIPEKQYGAGSVIVWDRGSWEPIGDPRAGLANGKLVFALHGEKMAGQWELIRIAKPGERQEAWLLFKKKDAWAQPTDAFDVVAALPDSVIAKPLGPADERGPGAAGPPLEEAAVAPPAPKRAARKTKVRAAAGPMPDSADTAAATSGPPAGAVEASLPESLAPQLATLAKAAPTAGDWIVEAKFDGYRILARIEGGKARLFTRNGNDWTDKLGSVAEAVESLGIDDSWLDGEIVVATSTGGQSFNALQNALDHAKNDSISYFLFDAPFLVGYDLRRATLEARRAALKNVVERSPHDRIRFSDSFPAPADEVLKAACAMKLEGIILKRRDASYTSARNDDWLKLKCTLRQEFVIGGYTDRSNSTKEVGNLFLGTYDEDGKLRYAGAMGTGWSLAMARELKDKLVAIEVDKSPFETGSTKQTRWTRRVAGAEHWVRPELVAEVAFAEWTPEGHLRHASFQGLRTDKPARAIVREQAVEPPSDEDAGTKAGPADDEPSAKAPSRPAAGPKTSTKAGTATKTKANTNASTDESTKTITNESTKTSTNATTRASTKSVDQPAPTTPAQKAARSPSDTAVAGIRVSSPDRVVDAASKATKLDLVRYYDNVAEFMLPHLRGRPVSLVRGPRGVGGELFFQKHLDAKIAGVRELDASMWPGHGPLMVIDSREALLSAAQMNTIEFHTWNATAPELDAPDRMIFDLDPGEGVTWKHIQEAAVLTHAMLDELGLVSFLKTSGGKGLHVVVPITPKLDWTTVKGFSQAIVQHLATTIPDRFVAKSGGSNRIGRIFVDYLRNGLGATTAVAFSARSRPGLGVSIPIAWDQLDAIESGAQWTIATARDAPSFRDGDPWADYASVRQGLDEAMERLGWQPA